MTEERTTSAVVEDVDPTTHQVLLRLPDDTLLTLKVGPGAGSLASLKPGDHVTAHYSEARLVGITPAPDQTGPLQTIQNTQGNTVQGDTTVVAVDTTGHTISFVGPGNVVQTIHVDGDAMIQALTKLHAGGRAQIAYTPAAAVALSAT
jgi:hypothetical protein